jgi:CBS domain-containing protein
MLRRSVKDLLTPGVIAIGPLAPMAEAASRMGRAGFGCLPVAAAGRPLGVVTERDIIRHARGGGELSAPVEGSMTRPVAALTRAHLLDDVCRTMSLKKARFVVVVGPRGEIEGVVEAAGVVEALAVEFMFADLPCAAVMTSPVLTVPPGTPLDAAVDLMLERGIGSLIVAEDALPQGIFTERDLVARICAGEALDGRPVEAIMRAPVVSVPPEIQIYKAILFMRQKGVRRVAVCGAGGALTGILTQSDLVRAFQAGA